MNQKSKFKTFFQTKYEFTSVKPYKYDLVDWLRRRKEKKMEYA